MEISASFVKELRERTNAGFMDCKTALKESDGDMEKAIEYLRIKGLAGGAEEEATDRRTKGSSSRTSTRAAASAFSSS